MATSKKSSSFKRTFLKCKIPLIGVGALIVVLALLFVFRGWVRVTVIPFKARLVYLHGVSQTLDTQSASLHNPLQRLGFAAVTTTNRCDLMLAQSIHTQVDCAAAQQGYAKLPSDASQFNAIVQQANQLQAQLLAAGWKAGSNGVTISGLISGTGHGVDYTPDANYEKIIGRNDCVLDVMVAYSNPQPPAIRATFACDRTLDYLGAPKFQLYDSAKGHM